MVILYEATLTTLCPVHGSLCVRICEPLDVPAKSNSPRGHGGYALL